jgi:uncharacterized radical SAM superfamily protein
MDAKTQAEFAAFAAEVYVCAYCEQIMTGVCLPCNEIDGATPIDEYLDEVKERAANMSLTDLVACYVAARDEETALMRTTERAHVDEYDLVADRACIYYFTMIARLASVDAAAVAA